MFFLHASGIYQRYTTLFLLLAIFTSQLSFLSFLKPAPAEAAVVTIDSTTSTDANAYFFGGSQTVFISDQVGYKFYVDSTGACVYSKTTNGGGGWGVAVIVDAQTDCASIAVWYDQWTPGDYGSYIHIATMETASTPDRLYYNRLDTTTDTRLLGTAPIQTSASSSQGGTFTSGTNNVTISKSTTGEVFMAISDGSDSFVVRCSTNCNLGASWTEAGSAFMDLDNDWNILMPLSSGQMLLINRDISANAVRSRVWNGSGWSVSWTNADTSAVESATYDTGMAATVDVSTGDILLAYAVDHDNYTTLDHDVRTARFSAGSWTNTADVVTNHATRGLVEVAIAQDSNTGNVYVAYSMRTTPGTAGTGNIYYASSTSAMSSWGTERGPVNSAAGDFRGMGMNLMSDERIYVTWYDPSPDDVFGETIADISPIIKLTASGTPTSTITASTSNVYTGGKLVLKETVTSRNVTDIVISESGTVAANTAIANVKLFYDLDTSNPYDCASESYGGSESQFGSTDTNGFSGADGTSAFTGLVSVSPTQAMCIYPVVDVLDAAVDGQTLSISIESPNDDVLVSGGQLVMPTGPVRFSTSTQIRNDNVTQVHYHWRNDNGNETGATSATAGVQDTAIPALQASNTRRLRIGLSNEGSLPAATTTYRLEYAEAITTCSAATGWIDVGAANDAWNMSNSSFITDGSNTTNIATASGGVSDENTTFLSTNGGLRDTSSQTGSLALSSTNYVDLEFSIVASSSAVEGSTYCFRVTASGTPLTTYNNYGEVTIAADLSVSATGTATSTVLIPTTNRYLGGTFVLKENVSSRNVTSITLSEFGTVNASTGLDNIKLFYDLDNSAPYNCASESYSGSETQFGSTDTDGFSDVNGSSTFSGSVLVSTTSIMCVYAVADITDTALNGETIKLGFTSPASDVVVSSGSVSPSVSIYQNGTTTLAGAVMTQENYHWRNNDGSEATSTSATVGNENTVLTDHSRNTPIRLRVGLSNEGAATSATSTYVLQFGPKVTTCGNVGVWTSVDLYSDDWDIYNSAFVANGDNTTNIATSTGGISDSNTTFISANSGVRDTSATTSNLQFSPTQFTELEFSLTSTNITAYSTTYCFRLANSVGGALPSYTNYAELTTGPKRDFKVQRGLTTLTGTSTALVAGVDYVAPSSSSLAFVRITDAHHTGPGRTTAGGGAQNADDITAYIANPNNLVSSFTIARPTTATGNARINWEIVEFIGDAGTDNEMFVRTASSINFPSASTTATGTVVSGISDDSDVAVFITGIQNQDIARNVYYAGQVTAEWDAANNRPIFKRGAGGAIINVSYAVVEFTGQNWRIQRVEHTYTGTSTETETITPVNSLARTFIHTQKRMGAQGNVNNFGHEVWLSSIGAVSFALESAATVPSAHVSVAWVIENQQTSNGAMKVQRTNGTTNAGTEPVTLPISIFTPIDSTANASIFVNTKVQGANTTFPLPMAGARITGTSTYELWRSEASGLMTYRTEIVEWPINGLAIRQNAYRFYVDNNEITPTDPWPLGAENIDESAVLSASDEPLGEGERVRLRMSFKVANATLPAGLYDFKLQYGLRSTPSCTAIASWTDLGAAGSGAIWRGYAATGTTNGVAVSSYPATSSELKLSVSDVGGSLIEENPAPANPYLAQAGDDVEFDWFVEHNGAIERSFYCFRMVKSDGTTLDGYFDYPQVRTAGFSPVTKNWRWYGDAENETPTSALSSENVAPIEVQNQDVIALRVTVGEKKNVLGQNVKFKLQYDESSDFSNARDVVSTTTCQATSTWCYAAGAALDNATVTTKLLTDADTCTGGIGNGCGKHNRSGAFTSGLTHAAGANAEYSFYLRHAAARAGAVYYFRLYEVLEDLPVIANTGETYPSLVAETAKLTFTVTGLNAGTTTSGVTLTATSAPSIIAFGSLPINADAYAAHRVSVNTNATEGYKVLMFARQQLLNTYGTPIAPITGTNLAPTAWLTGCVTSADGCVGYHTTDATLAGGSTRFSPLDSYAGLSTSTAEVMYSPIPANESHDILYRVKVGPEQPAGTYETEVVYIALPTY